MRVGHKTFNKNKRAEKYIYFIIVFMAVLVITSILQLVSNNGKTKQNTQSKNETFDGSEMYIMTLGRLTEEELSKLSNKYKCTFILTDDTTNNVSYKLMFKDNLSDTKLNNIKEELKQLNNIVLITIPAKSN